MKISNRDQVLDLLKILKDHDFYVIGVDDGEEYYERPNDSHINDIDVLGWVLAVDECKIYVIDTVNNSTTWLYLVFGNDPGELVCDYLIAKSEGTAKKMDSAMEVYFNYYELNNEGKVIDTFDLQNENEELKKEVLEQCRLLGISASIELGLITKLNMLREAWKLCEVPNILNGSDEFVSVKIPRKSLSTFILHLDSESKFR